MEKVFEKININVEDNKIFGYLYMPHCDNKVPLVIYSQELANTLEIAIPYADFFASNKMATYIFDYPGNSNDSKSVGKTTDMTISSEVKILEKVFKESKKWPNIDPNNIFVIGASQGGLVASLFAEKHNDDLKALILMYPGFNIYDGFHGAFNSLEDVQKEFSFRGWITLGKKYVEDIWHVNPYDVIGFFKKNVLILHGDSDDIVPIKYSEKAVEMYENAKLVVMPGAHHIFRNDNQKIAAKYILDFINENTKD